MEKKSLRDFYQGLDEEKKRTVHVDIANGLHRPISTVYSWLIGQRKICSPLEAEFVREYVRKNFNIEIN